MRRAEDIHAAAPHALDVTSSRGTVTVEAGPDANQGACIIILRGTRIGIDPKDVARIMRPFGQVPSAQAGRPKGTGLGMPLTRQYVEMLDGTLSLASRPGEGTVVTIRLPKQPPTIRAEPAGAASAAGA